jgi:hypothetical protein
MKKTKLEIEFRNYIEKVYPRGIPHHQLRELRMAWHGSALCVVGIMHDIADMPDCDDQMKQFYTEVLDACKNIAAEAATFQQRN